MDFKSANKKARSCEACGVDYALTKAFDLCGCGLPTVERELLWGEKPLDVAESAREKARLQGLAHKRLAFEAYYDAYQRDAEAMHADPDAAVADLLAGVTRLLDPPPF